MRFFVPLIFSGVLGLFSSFDNDILLRLLEAVFRVVAQLGRALRSGRRGRRFKSCQPDQGKSQAECLKGVRPALFPGFQTVGRFPVAQLS